MKSPSVSLPPCFVAALAMLGGLAGCYHQPSQVDVARMQADAMARNEQYAAVARSRQPRAGAAEVQSSEDTTPAPPADVPDLSSFFGERGDGLLPTAFAGLDSSKSMREVARRFPGDRDADSIVTKAKTAGIEQFEFYFDNGKLGCIAVVFDGKITGKQGAWNYLVKLARRKYGPWSDANEQDGVTWVTDSGAEVVLTKVADAAPKAGKRAHPGQYVLAIDYNPNG